MILRYIHPIGGSNFTKCDIIGRTGMKRDGVRAINHGRASDS